MKHIGILGGSFDPPHMGHVMLALCGFSLVGLDEIWVIPCFDHPFSKDLSPFKKRLMLCQLAFEPLKHTHILDIESHLPAPSYTLQTLDALQPKYPNAQFHLLIGSDLLPTLPSWHGYEELVQKHKFHVFFRHGFPILKTKEHPNIYLYPELELPHVQSRLLKENLKEYPNLIPKQILENL